MKKILLTLLLLPLLAVAQNNRLYNTQHGLLTSNISSLCLDKRGLLWIASNATLAYFDGAGFHYLPNKNPETGQPYFHGISQVKEDKKENCYWLMTNLGLYFYDSRLMTYERVYITPEESSTHGYAITQMVDIPGNDDEKIVVTSGYGIHYLNVNTHKIDIEKSLKMQKMLKASFIVYAYVDHLGHLWSNSIHNDLMCLDLKTNKLIPLEMTEEATNLLKVQEINCMLDIPSHDAIYMTTDDGVLKYNGKNKRIEFIQQTKGRPYSKLLYSQDGELLLGTDSYGVWQLDQGDNLSYFEMEHQVYDLSTGKVKDIVEDVEGNLIVALFQKGVLIMPKQDDAFRYHSISLKGNGKNSSCITSLKIDKQGNYWIASDGSGMFTTDGTHMSTAHPINDGLKSLLIQSVELDREDGVWVGSYGGGVQKFDKATNRFITPDWLNSLKDTRVLSLAIDRSNGILYAGTSGQGVYAINLNTHTVERIKYDDALADWITTIFVDDDHTLWVAEVGYVSFHNPMTGAHGRLKPETHTNSVQCISSLGTGNTKRILLGSSDGLLVYNPQDGTIENWLTDKPVLSINQTNNELWIASMSCIYAIDKKTHDICTYNSLGGYYAGEFHRAATLDNKIGNLLYGCDNGIICFTPSAIHRERKMLHQILFTSLEVGNQTINYSDSPSSMDANILNATEIWLKQNQNTFSLYFNMPNLGLSQQTHYEYKLEGYEKKWNTCRDVTTQHANYTNLAPGTYTLHVKAYLEGTPENYIEKEIKIHVAAPWYDTTLAHLIYLLILCGIGYMIYRVWDNRRKQKAALQEALHSEHIKEEKLRLFTSITHELRTPLTMIISPLKQMLLNVKDEQTRSDLNVMKHNCERLLDTVKQLTDIRKIDSGQFDLHFEEVDLCSYMHDVAQSFMIAATAKHINFSIESNESSISAWVDPIHFEKIVVNILSNAFKFCPENGKILIRIRRKGDSIQLCIFNSGTHIDENDMKHIFERFYQSAEGQKHVGSGIGLNLAYELVQLHHSQITCENIDPDGVEFGITIPTGCAHLSAQELEPRPNEENNSNLLAMETAEQESNQQSLQTHLQTIHTEANTNEGNSEEETSSRQPLLLIVDDSKELCEYLRDQLSPYYNVTLAFSGNSAWNIMLQSRPDLVITDMKMPDGDGIELCRKIKSNPEFDHTPIIMLTGEGNETIQLESLTLQVDHYIQKPFNMTILQGIIRQVLGVRENLKRHIQRKKLSNDYQSVDLPSVEDQLFERINEAVQNHLDDDQFGVQELAVEVGISRVHLNRKMKEKYGLSPNVFIKSYRLKQAAYLLLHKHVNVSEVAYRVGFSTHSYFSSSFREFFGMTPKDFINYYNDPENADKLEKILHG